MEWICQNCLPLAVRITFLILMKRGNMCCGRRREHLPDTAGKVGASSEPKKTDNALASDERKLESKP